MEFSAFPGQGTQAKGMGRRLAARHPVADSLLRSLEEYTGIPLRELMWDASAEFLTRTENAQPAIVAYSLAALEAWRAIAPDRSSGWVAGHSVGALAAAVACGSLSPGEGVRLARRRGEIMAAAPEKGRMLAVTVASDEARSSLSALADQLELDLACFNGPRQIVLAGASDRIAAARQRLGPRSVELTVSNAFHSRLMDPVVPSWRNELAITRFEDPSTPYLSSRTGKLVMDGDGVRNDLMKGLREPVRWDLVTQKAVRCRRGRVFGSGKALRRMWRGTPIAPAMSVVDDDFPEVACG